MGGRGLVSDLEAGGHVALQDESYRSIAVRLDQLPLRLIDQTLSEHHAGVPVGG
jgi:hypothetical protein